MFDCVFEIKNLVFDTSKSWGNVIAKSISLIVFLVLIDISVNFTYDLHTSNKLSQLEIISTLKKEYKTDAKKIARINQIENKIFRKKHYSEILPLVFSNIFYIKKDKIQDNQFIENENSDKNNLKSLFWMVISSNYLLIFILPFFIFLPLYNREIRTSNGIAGWITSLVMLGGIISLITLIAYQIPLIWKNPNWNYFVNFLIHTIIWVVILKFGLKKSS